LASMITVRRAKEEIKRLQLYVNLAESYETDTLEKVIIKEYAYTNSMFEVSRNLNRQGYLINGLPIDKEYVSCVINQKPADELHRILKSGYLKRTKHSRHK
jgi:hypothetical protein